MAEIHWTLAAEADLRGIEDFISMDSAIYAIDFVGQLIESSEILDANPEIGRVVPEFQDQNIRELLIRGYRQIYLLELNEPVILRAIHGARDLRSLVDREPWTLE